MDSKERSGSARRASIARVVVAAACIYFVAAGVLLIPYFGVQNDEALFASAVYPPIGVVYSVRVSHHQLPLMLMTYLGTLKAFLYRAVFRFCTPSAFSLRIPVLLAGTLTIALVYVLLRRTVALRAALIACVLLATDPIFLLTNTFDWGPVALQHLCLVGGICAVVASHRTRSWKALAAGFFLFGLGLWDKALFIWSLVGLAAATLAVFPRELFRSITPRFAAAAVGGLVLGALPLLVYNAQNEFKTFRGNAVYSTADFSHKVRLLRTGMDGSGLIDWLVPARTVAGARLKPQSPAEKASIWLEAALPGTKSNWMPYAFLVALGLLPVLCWRRAPGWRAGLFSLVFLAVTWLQMALVQNAGGGLHHTVLLWPFPHILVGASFGGASYWLGRAGRPVLVLLLSALAVTNVVVTNRYYALAIQNGSSLNWTDAIYPLARFAERYRPALLYPLDWGILDGLRLLGRGTLPLRVGTEPLDREPLSAEGREELRRRVSDPRNLFVSHTPGSEFFVGLPARLDAVAAAFGYSREILAVIPDRNGRPIFEAFRYRNSAELTITPSSRRSAAPGGSGGSISKSTRTGPAVSSAGATGRE